MKYVFAIILYIHGFIHLIGFAKSYYFTDVNKQVLGIPKPIGAIWLLVFIMFIVSASSFLTNKKWFYITFIAVCISQVLIILAWEDAKFGTIANVIILIVAIIGLATWNFESNYKKDATWAIRATSLNEDIITQHDLDALPPIIQKYLNYVGVLGKPKIKNVKIIFEGKMRDKGKDWLPFSSEQYNFMETPTRLFFIKVKVKGSPTNGYHAYNKESARMLIKVLSLFAVVDISNNELYTTETVTFFNDLCLFAPGALIDKRIQWETIDYQSVKATFTNNRASISAILYFNATGQLVNFISKDQYSVSEMKAYPFSTPAKDYKNISGYHLPTYGEAIWHYPDEEFVYGRFNLKSIEYNVSN